MTIRKQTLVTLAVTVAALGVVLSLVLSGLLNAGFSAVERHEAELNLDRLRQAFRNDIDGLCEKTSDWAKWDDAYRFAVDRNPAFVESNFAPTTFEGTKVALIVIFDRQGNELLGKGYDSATGEMREAPRPLLGEHFGAASPLLDHRSENSVHSGLLLPAEQPPLLVCSMPIVTTEGRGPIHGTIVFGRAFDPKARTALGRITRLDLAFAAQGEPGFAGDLAAALPRLVHPEATLVEVVSETQLLGYTRFVDLYGGQSLVARAVMPRDVHRQARLTLGYAVVALALIGLVFALVMMVLLERLVLGRLARLSAQVTHVTEAFDFSARVESGRDDEIGRLGGALNSLLAAAEQVCYAGNEAEAKYGALQAHLPVALACQDLVVDESGVTQDLVFREMTDAFAAAAGLRKDALGRTLSETLALPAESRSAWLAAVDRARRSPGPQSFALGVGAKGVRVTVAAIDGRRVMVHLRALPAEEKGGGPGMAG